LDIGCGECLLAWLLFERRKDIEKVIGIDASPEMIKRANEIWMAGLEVKQGFAEELPFLSSEFDTVVMGQVLEHVRDPLSCAVEALRVLRYGGRLIVNVPADEQGPHGNHLRAYKSLSELTQLFGVAIDWTGEGRLHRYWYAWGERK
jgi:ubiquinone/menaquinone biosynthesis C-methylase UbiE